MERAGSGHAARDLEPSVLLLLSLVNPAAHAAAHDAQIHPGHGDETVTLRHVAGQWMLEELPVGLSGRVVVELQDDDPAWLIAHPDVADVEPLGLPGFYRVTLHSGDELALAEAWWADPRTRSSHPDLLVEHAPDGFEPDDPYFDNQWHLANTGQAAADSDPTVDLNIEAAWAITAGAGQVVGVIDSGVDLDHPDLDVIDSWAPGDQDANPDPEYSGYAHGTAMGGIAAATGANGIGVVGVAPEAQMVAVRMLGATESVSDVALSIVNAVDMGATVLNNSWGIGDCPTFSLWSEVAAAMAYAEEQGRDGLGTAFVMSMGNDNCDSSGDGYLRYPSVVGVGSSTDQDKRAGYSNYGDTIDIMALGSQHGRPLIVTTDIEGETGYGAYAGDHNYTGGATGTSASAPMVAGAMALMFAANPRLTAAVARDVLCETAVRIDLDNGEYNESGWSPWYGCGRLDVGAAVQTVANGAPEAPELLGPEETVTTNAVRLEWSVDDPDGDELIYTITLWDADDPEGWTDRRVTYDTHLDLVNQLYPGTRVGWNVVASDLWGEGAVSADGEFTVTENPAIEDPWTAPDDPGTCGHAPMGGLLLVGLAAVWRRRERAS